MKTRHLALAALCAAAFSAPAYAVDTIKVAISHQTSWDTVFPQIAVKNGFFKEQNIEPEMVRLIVGPPNIAAMITNQIDAAAVLVTIEGGSVT